MFKEKNSAAPPTPATLCRAVSQTRSLSAINSFLLPVLTVPPVRQAPQTIRSSQGTKGVRVREDILWNTVKQPPFTNTYYRKSGPFSILLPTIPYQVVLHPWTADTPLRFWKCCSLWCQEALQVPGLYDCWAIYGCRAIYLCAYVRICVSHSDMNILAYYSPPPPQTIRL